MEGIYRIYKDGNLIAEQKNKMTLLGRANAIKAMLGLTQSFASSMGIGVSSTENEGTTFLTINDLDFCVGQYPITSATLGLDQSSNDAIIFTTRITDPSRYSITELGLYSNKVTNNASNTTTTIFDFESGDPLKETVSSIDYYLDDSSKPSSKAEIMSDKANYRIGSNAVKLSSNNESAGSIFFNDSTLNLSSIGAYDYIVLSLYFSIATTISVIFNDGTNSATYEFNYSGTGAAYKTISLNKSSATGYDEVDWTAIKSITISRPRGTEGYVILDGLRIKKYNPIDSTDGLVSRIVLETAIEKDAGSIIDVQYILSMKMET